MATPAADAAWLLANEFAQVQLRIDRQGRDLRLRIDDLRHDRVVWLDAFQLACLTGLAESDWRRLMDPAGPAAEPGAIGQADAA